MYHYPEFNNKYLFLTYFLLLIFNKILNNFSSPKRPTRKRTDPRNKSEDDSVGYHEWQRGPPG